MLSSLDFPTVVFVDECYERIKQDIKTGPEKWPAVLSHNQSGEVKMLQRTFDAQNSL